MKQFDHHLNSNAIALEIDEMDVAQRKAFLELTDEDINLLKKIHDLLIPFQSEFVDIFYEHIFSFKEMRDVLSRSDISIESLKSTQLAYFQSLTSGNYDVDYFDNRLKVGLAHARIGLDTRWYIGAYRK